MYRVVLVIAQFDKAMALKLAKQVKHGQVLTHRFMGNDRVGDLVWITVAGIGFQPWKHHEQYAKTMRISKLGKLGKGMSQSANPFFIPVPGRR